MPETGIVTWTASEAVIVPASARTVADIASLARQLSPRERQQLVQAFNSDLVEMGSTFVWTRTMAGLKTRLATLGVDFIAEMLDRPDIRPTAEIHEVLTDYEAVRLAEELGMVNSTLAMRLRQNLELVAHFSNRPEDAADDEMMPEDAIGVLRTCVQAVLGHEDLEIAVKFADFRSRLEKTVLESDSPEIIGVASSAYFFKRTVLRILLAGSKSLTGAQLDNILANTNILVPTLWPELKDPDRYMVGRAYAELHAEGQTAAVNGLRSALLKVSGFDYVPESMRSQAFIEAAAKVQLAHFAMNNFYNEPAPMRALAALGTSIPRPAFNKCMTAILLVRMGNRYGVTWAAQESATQMLRSVTLDRWVYFFNECLPVDDVLLTELQGDVVAKRWCEAIRSLPRLKSLTGGDGPARQLVASTMDGDARGVVRRAEELRTAMKAPRANS